MVFFIVFYTLSMAFSIAEGQTYYEPFVGTNFSECGIFCKNGVRQWNALHDAAFAGQPMKEKTQRLFDTEVNCKNWFASQTKTQKFWTCLAENSKPVGYTAKFADGECEKWVTSQTQKFGVCGIVGGSFSYYKNHFNCESVSKTRHDSPCLGNIRYGDDNTNKELTLALVSSSFAPKQTQYLDSDGTNATFYEITLKGNGYPSVTVGNNTSENCEMTASIALRVCDTCDCGGKLVK